MSLKVVIFGAGCTGRGHVGELVYASGHDITFVDRDDSLVSELAAARAYTVRLYGAATRDVHVEGFRVLSLTAAADVAEAVASADLVLTAVMAENLRQVARHLAPGLARRARAGTEVPLNVVGCENMVSASTFLRREVLPLLPDDCRTHVQRHVGFPDAMVSRVVTTPRQSRLLLEAEDYNEWPVDRGAFLGPDPGIAGLCLVDNLPALLERKLYLHNTGHAVCGYLGHLKGYEYVCDAIVDPAIRPVVEAAMAESGRALVHKHGFTPESIEHYRTAFPPRAEGRAILDPIRRVVRSPQRKIGRQERLLGPACMALDYGIDPANLAVGIAALLRYRAEDDAESLLLQQALADGGVAATLARFGGLDTDRYSRLVRLVQQALDRGSAP